VEVARDLQPLGVLVEHGVDDVHEGLVGREEAVASGQQVAFEPALEGVLGEHLHHAAVDPELGPVGVVGQGLGHPALLGDGVGGVELVRGGLVGTEQAEVAGIGGQRVAQQGAERPRVLRQGLPGRHGGDAVGTEVG
jgi:hypothetical protein